MIAKYRASGDINHPLVEFEMSYIRDFFILERNTIDTTSYCDMISSKANCYRLFITNLSASLGNGLKTKYQKTLVIF